MAWIQAHSALVLGCLLAVSELLDAVPGIQASSIWKLVYGVIKGLSSPPSPPVA